MKKQFLLFALGAVAIGCSSDVTSVASVSPDPDSCSKGSISVGDVKTGSLTAASCVRYDYAYAEDSTPYDGYNFKAEKGKGYMFMLENADDTAQWDALLELVTVDPSTGKEQLLAISDDEGNHGFSRMYFIAPVSGTFFLRAGAYSTRDYSSYKLTAKSCDSPIPEITGTLTASQQTLATSDCILARPEFVDDSTHVKLFSLNVGPNETKTVTVTSEDFPPGFQIYGPAWGQSCNYSYEGCGGGSANVGPSDTQSFTVTGQGNETCLGVGSVHGCEFLNFPGQYTIAVGSSFEATGSFTISVTEGTPPGRIVGPDAPSRNPTLNFLRKKPLQASQYFDRAQ